MGYRTYLSHTSIDESAKSAQAGKSVSNLLNNSIYEIDNINKVFSQSGGSCRSSTTACSRYDTKVIIPYISCHKKKLILTRN